MVVNILLKEISKTQMRSSSKSFVLEFILLKSVYTVLFVFRVEYEVMLLSIALTVFEVVNECFTSTKHSHASFSYLMYDQILDNILEQVLFYSIIINYVIFLSLLISQDTNYF